MLKIFNTLGREQQIFTPIEDGKVRMYQCGPTVYSTQHIGNMRAAVVGDLVARSLKYLGYDLKFVRNYTDFGHLTGDNIGDADSGEDRMEKGARKEGITPKEIADKYINEFEIDVSELNTQVPTVIARATDYIDAMIEMVQVLVEKGFAYITPTAVFFEVDKFSEYTKLSGQNLEMNISGEGHGGVSDSNKKKPYDFAVWFFRTGDHSNALQFWPSPFESTLVENGNGFPGWHIECSAMIKKNLGETIDIHIGGVEHIPTHHTNEIAQSKSANGKDYVNYWMHNEHLLVNGEKMSKSQGTAYNVQELKNKGYNPLSLRYFFLQAQYRSKQNFTLEALDASKKAYERLMNFVDGWSKDASTKTLTGSEINQDFKKKFIESLEEDFNIPQALAVLWDLTKSPLSSQVKLATALDFDRVLGLNLGLEIENPKSLELSAEAQALIEERNIARLDKDWKKADELRDQLSLEYGIKVKDSAEGQIIEQV